MGILERELGLGVGGPVFFRKRGGDVEAAPGVEMHHGWMMRNRDSSIRLIVNSTDKEATARGSHCGSAEKNWNKANAVYYGIVCIAYTTV